MKINIAIFASGSGTNAENIIQYFAHNEKIEISLIVSNKSDAYVLERAKKFGVKSQVVSSSQMKDQDYVLSLLKENNINFIVLAGYLLKIPPYLISQFPNAIVNIHPALLPKFGGKGMYGDNVHKAVVEAKEKESGITVHFVNENYDEGTSIFQAKCPVLPTDTYEDVASKVHKLEYAYFPQAIESVCAKMI
jgi:phosphoribosylglycinamide formyltransferase, formyltetrahydrofolate-dependent